MKLQHILLPIFVVSSFSLSSCQSDALNGKVPVRKIENIDSYVRIQSQNELMRIARYESAVIMVDEKGCASCNKVLPLIIDFVKETEYLIYVVDYSTVYINALNDSSNITGEYAGLFPNIKYTPSFLYYHDGKIVDAHDGGYTEGTLASNISSNIKEIGYYSLNTYIKDEDPQYQDFYYTQDFDEDNNIQGYDTAILDKKISEGNVMVVYSWRECSDCKDFYNSFFYSYMNDHPNIKIYFYETDGYYQLKRSSDKALAKDGLEKWASFSSSHYLTDYQGIYDKLNIPTGVVPTMIYYGNNTHSTFVYRNSTNVYKNSEGYLQYGTAFLDDVKSLKSDSKVSNDDVSSSSYQKALKELEEKALKVERTKMKEFFDAYF